MWLYFELSHLMVGEIRVICPSPLPIPQVKFVYILLTIILAFYIKLKVKGRHNFYSKRKLLRAFATGLSEENYTLHEILTFCNFLQ